MPRPATGQVVERETARGTVFALRFRAYGDREYVTLGAECEGWTTAKAEDELEHVMGQVRRGTWRRESPTTVAQEDLPASTPTFRVFASDWLADKAPSLAAKTVSSYTWQLTDHLLPFFARHRLEEITVAEIDRYRHFKVREGRLCGGEINRTLTRLGQILDVADEYDLIDRNPLRKNPKNRRLKVSKPRAVWLDRAEQIKSLLEAARALDVEARADRRHVRRGVIIATLVFAGLRMDELCGLRWRDVDLAGGRLNVADSKTDAGRRYVDLLAPLREDLAAIRPPNARGSAYVFATREAGRPDGNHLRSRVFNAAVARANATLEDDGHAQLPEGLTPHKMRHTFASLLVATGADPVHVMEQLGHTDPAFSLRIYSHAMRRDPGERARLRALIQGVDWALDTSVEAEASVTI